MQPDDGRALSEAAIEALLAEVLRECALEPLLLLDAARSGSTLVRIARNGAAGPDPFDEILIDAYESTRAPMIGWATAEVTDPEDIVRTAFMRVYARRPDITEAEDMREYLWRTTENLIRDTPRHKTADRLDPAGDERIALLAERTGLSFEDTITLRHMLIAALETLPQREREAVVLRGYEGSTYAEIGLIMGLAPDTVESHIHDALAEVSARLQAA
ncbi:RNA polymerase sigma factor [Nocardia sp. XZ_19_385]|uniref:RNA polymerase sigma factor n=1 Tax=Nocardia sp. XZ_19_385 TaxID=2769488 RepID=UPI00188EC241|nr:sigma-70 family RNA polymerase sigma factor [Nocardia sp. XZ_19_385]